MIAWFGQSRKAITALVVGVIGWFTATPDLHHVTKSGWIALAVIIASACGVYSVSNDPSPSQQLTQSAQDAGYVYQEPTVIPASERSGTPGSSAPPVEPPPSEAPTP